MPEQTLSLIPPPQCTQLIHPPSSQGFSAAEVPSGVANR